MEPGTRWSYVELDPEGGELTVESSEVLAEDVESVECGWCGPSGAVETLTEG